MNKVFLFTLTILILVLGFVLNPSVSYAFSPRKTYHVHIQVSTGNFTSDQFVSKYLVPNHVVSFYLNGSKTAVKSYKCVSVADAYDGHAFCDDQDLYIPAGSYKVVFTKISGYSIRLDIVYLWSRPLVGFYDPARVSHSLSDNTYYFNTSNVFNKFGEMKFYVVYNNNSFGQ